MVNTSMVHKGGLHFWICVMLVDVGLLWRLIMIMMFPQYSQAFLHEPSLTPKSIMGPRCMGKHPQRSRDVADLDGAAATKSGTRAEGREH